LHTQRSFHLFKYSCSVDTEACATATAQGNPTLDVYPPVWMLVAARIRNHFSVQARTLRSHDSAIHKNVSATAPSVFNSTGECQGIHRSGMPPNTHSPPPSWSVFHGGRVPPSPPTGCGHLPHTPTLESSPLASRT
jgi:hypothetical protein